MIAAVAGARSRGKILTSVTNDAQRRCLGAVKKHVNNESASIEK
jgi:hypothetical protein